MEQIPMQQPAGHLNEETLRLFAEMQINPDIRFDHHLNVRLPQQVMRDMAEENAYVERMMVQEPDILDPKPVTSQVERLERKAQWTQFLRTSNELRTRVEMHFRIQYARALVARDVSVSIRAKRTVQQLESHLLCTACPREKILRIRQRYIPNANGGIASPPRLMSDANRRRENPNEITKEVAQTPARRKTREDARRKLSF